MLVWLGLIFKFVTTQTWKLSHCKYFSSCLDYFPNLCSLYVGLSDVFAFGDLFYAETLYLFKFLPICIPCSLISVIFFIWFLGEKNRGRIDY